MTKPPATGPQSPPAGRRRPRRSAEEVTRRLLDAAVEEFSERGFDGARTATIARRAGVVEPLLFKYFGSKANLFQRSVFENLDRNYTRFVEVHSGDSPEDSTREGQARQYVGQQQDFLRENARMFMSLIVHEAFDREGGESVGTLSGLQQFLDKLSAYAAARMDDPDAVDHRLIARISFGSLLACTLFRDWLFPSELADDEKIRAAIIDYILKGADVGPQRSDRTG